MYALTVIMLNQLQEIAERLLRADKDSSAIQFTNAIMLDGDLSCCLIEVTYRQSVGLFVCETTSHHCSLTNCSYQSLVQLCNPTAEISVSHSKSGSINVTTVSEFCVEAQNSHFYTCSFAYDAVSIWILLSLLLLLLLLNIWNIAKITQSTSTIWHYGNVLQKRNPFLISTVLLRQCLQQKCSFVNINYPPTCPRLSVNFQHFPHLISFPNLSSFQDFRINITLQFSPAKKSCFLNNMSNANWLKMLWTVKNSDTVKLHM